MTATSLALLEALDQLGAVDVEDAGRAVRVGGEDRQLPALPGARVDAHALERDRQQPGGHLLAGGDHRVVFARIVQRRGVAAPADQLVGLAGHGGDHDGDLMAGIDLALDVARDVADAVDVGDRRAAEFHDEAGHGGRLRTFRQVAGETAYWQAPAQKGAYTYRWGRKPQPGAPDKPCEEQSMASEPQSHERAESTVDPAEVERFSALAAEWWDPHGKMALLHKFNPVRLGYIREAAAGTSTAIAKRLDALKGLRILDIGCGGGILSRAAGAARRRRGRRRSGATPISRRRRLHAAQVRARDRLSRHHRRGAGRRRRALRHRARHGGGRARRRCAAVRRSAAPRW